MYYVILAPDINRQIVLDEFKRNGIGAVFHYIPLHSSPAGQRYGRVNGSLSVTNNLSRKLIRLPLWVGLTEQQQDKIVSAIKNAINFSC